VAIPSTFETNRKRKAFHLTPVKNFADAPTELHYRIPGRDSRGIHLSAKPTARLVYQCDFHARGNRTGRVVAMALGHASLNPAMRRARKPIRVFYSVLSQRFYATRAWRESEANGKRFIEVTGEQFDVTDDIASLIEQHQIEFKRRTT
jgi:hypothetical protein